jgi:thiamine phosphate synthase YjbQ (UPF0047 family)
VAQQTKLTTTQQNKSVENHLQPRSANLDEASKRDKQDTVYAQNNTNVPVTINEIELTPEQQTQQQELDTWVTEHKQNLRENLTAHLPSSILDGMLEQITKNNAFLDELSVKQDVNVDEQWAYTMEQEIRDIIQRHALGNNIELFSVVCKQLTCELTGKELQPGTWQQVFMALFIHMNQSNKKLVDEMGKNVSYLEDDLMYFYSQFVFAGP